SFTYASSISLFFLFTSAAPSAIYTLSLHDALPISSDLNIDELYRRTILALRSEGLTDIAVPEKTLRSYLSHSKKKGGRTTRSQRSEEHTSELQSRFDLVCRLLLEKKKQKLNYTLTC